MKRNVSWFKVLWLVLGVLYFLVPLLATLQFSLKEGRDEYGFWAYTYILTDPMFRDSIWFSFKMAAGTIALSLVLVVPTVYWVRLKLPRLQPVVEFIAILPFVVPPIVLVVGLLNLYRGAPQWFVATPMILLCGYVIHALPYVYRSVDAGMQAINIHTLTEAAQSLGAGWGTILLRVIVPNLRVALLSGSFLTLAIILGEYTMASLMLFNAFAVYIVYVGETQANPAAALTLISFAITWIAMMGLSAVGRRAGAGQAQIGGAR
ncbi:MAG: ABC transporter permease subunit [Actinomycetota bacterium]|nr:ABC transporter permease subunit [Actinomycetota bacterium]